MRPLGNWFGRNLPTRYNPRGQGMAEMLLVLPFLLIFFFGVIELSQLANTHHRVSTLSREAADAAFKTCVHDDIETESVYNACLEGVRALINSEAEETLLDFSTKGAVIVSLYGYNPSTGLLERLGISAETNGFHTRYNAGNIDADLLAKGHEVLAYGEVFYKNEWHTPLGKLMTFFLPQEIYEVCIF